MSAQRPGWIVRLARGGIHLYRGSLSPLLPRACRFEPSCSTYALEALARHGAIKGLGLALRRLGRCHPWGGFGFDPVPPVSDFTSEEKSATQTPSSLPPRSL